MCCVIVQFTLSFIDWGLLVDLNCWQLQFYCPVYDFDAHEWMIIQKPDRTGRLMWTCNYRCGRAFSRWQFTVSVWLEPNGKHWYWSTTHRRKRALIAISPAAVCLVFHFVGFDDKSDLMIGYSFGFSCLVIKVKGYFFLFFDMFTQSGHIHSLSALEQCIEFQCSQRE